MSDVKRYDPINQDGTCGVCIEDADYGAYVEYADYAALEAELDRLLEGRVLDAETISTLEQELKQSRDAYQNIIDQTTPLEPVPGDPRWSKRIELDEVIAERDQLRAELAAIKGQSGFDYSIRTQSTNRISAPAVDIGRNAAFEACPDTGCDWSSFYRGWNAALAASTGQEAVDQ